MTIATPRWRVWTVRAGAFGIAGVIGAGLVGVVVELVLSESAEWLSLMPFTGVAVVCLMLPLRWLVLPDDGERPAWAAVLAATIPIILTALLATVVVGLGTQSIEATIYDAALFQLLQIPLTIVLVVTAVGLETPRTTWR